MTFAVDIPCVLSVFIYDLPTEEFFFLLSSSLWEVFRIMRSYGYDWLYNSDLSDWIMKYIYTYIYTSYKKMGENGHLKTDWYSTKYSQKQLYV